MKKRQPEFDEQCAVILWARARYEEAPEKWPDLDLLHCSLSGVKLSTAQAAKAKAAGMRKGVLDLSLDKPMHGYYGLRIEMKARKSSGYSPTTTAEQSKEVRRLNGNGYYACICYGADAAKVVIRAYYEGSLK